MVLQKQSHSFFVLATTIAATLNTEKPMNLGDGLQIPCNLHFTGHVNFIKPFTAIGAMEMQMCLYFSIWVSLTL